MHDDFSCNCEELANHCNDLMSRGCRGSVLFGTTGEGSSFSVEERENALRTLIKLGVDPQRLIIGISCSSIADAVKLASTAIDQNCSAVMIVPPFFYKNVEDAGVVAFYREVIKRVGCPDLKIFLYHIPQYSGVPINLKIIKTLREEFPNNIIGIKESEGKLSFTKKILTAFPGFKVFVGNETQISEAVHLGAMGGISGLANAYPELICSLYECGKEKKKSNNHEIVESIILALSKYPLFPAIKNIVEKEKGSAWHILRPPLNGLEKKQSRALGIELIESLIHNTNIIK